MYLSIAFAYREWAKNDNCLIRHTSKSVFFNTTEPYPDFQQHLIKFHKKDTRNSPSPKVANLTSEAKQDRPYSQIPDFCLGNKQVEIPLR